MGARGNAQIKNKKIGRLQAYFTYKGFSTIYKKCLIVKIKQRIYLQQVYVYKTTTH